MDRTRWTGVAIFVWAVVLGLLADLLLRDVPWGIGAAVLAAAATIVLLVLQHHHGTPAGPGRMVYATVALVLAASFVGRDADVLKLLTVLGLFVAWGLLASERAGSRGPTVATCGVRVAGTAGHGLWGACLLLFGDIPWAELPVGRWLALALRLTRALAVGLPIVGLFAMLLGGADAVFRARLAMIFDVDLVSVAFHCIVVAACAWVAAGILRAAVIRAQPLEVWVPRPSGLVGGATDAAVVTGLLDLLFAAFVWIQMRYLFGGAAWVDRASGLTYAEYARDGFFQLVAVVGLVLPLLLVTHWVQGEKVGAAFKALAVVQVALVLVILASALQRMALYRAEYGLTHLRLYTTAFMLWMGALLLGFVATVLRGDREAFGRLTLVTALAAVVLLHAIDPDRLIVATNQHLAHEFDAAYAVGLSADAVPALLDVWPSLPEGPRVLVAQTLLAKWAGEEEPIRTWSFARSRARAEVAAAAHRLHAYLGGERWTTR
jgi:hypothetical protein